MNMALLLNKILCKYKYSNENHLPTRPFNVVEGFQMRNYARDCKTARGLLRSKYIAHLTTSLIKISKSGFVDQGASIFFRPLTLTSRMFAAAWARRMHSSTLFKSSQ